MQVTDEMVRAALRKAPKFWRDYDSSADQMRAVITAALAAMWRPISEAPKLPEPGQYSPPIVRLWDGTRERHGYWNDDRYKKEPRPYWRYSDSNAVTNDRANQPTHFMPLPQPPKTEDE